MKQAIELSIAAIVLGVLIIAAVVAGQNYITAEFRGAAFVTLKIGVYCATSGLAVIGVCRLFIKLGIY